MTKLNHTKAKWDIARFFCYALLMSCLFSRGIFMLYLTHKGLTVAQVGLYQMLVQLSMFLLEVPTGSIGDKLGKIRSLQIGTLLLLLHCVLMMALRQPAALIALVVEMGGVKFFPMLLKAPYHYLYPGILVVALIGVYTNTNNMFGIFMTLVFTGLGLWMSYAGIPATPFILAFVLGETLESNFRKAVSFARGDMSTFFTRPVSCILLLIAIFSVVRPFAVDYWKKRKAKA